MRTWPASSTNTAAPSASRSSARVPTSSARCTAAPASRTVTRAARADTPYRGTAGRRVPEHAVGPALRRLDLVVGRGDVLEPRVHLAGAEGSPGVPELGLGDLQVPVGRLGVPPHQRRREPEQQHDDERDPPAHHPHRLLPVSSDRPEA